MGQKKLIRVGYWWSKGETGLPTPIADSDTLWEEDRDIVVGYLKSGVIHQRYKGWSNCRICGAVNGTTDMTDGVYVWPSGLYHYVEAHKVALRKDFITHILDGHG